MAHDAAPAASMPQVVVPDAAFQYRHASQPVAFPSHDALSLPVAPYLPEQRIDACTR
jgi:hypothetical protein